MAKTKADRTSPNGEFERITFEVPVGLKSKIAEHARDRDMTTSRFLRGLVRAHLNAASTPKSEAAR